MAGKDSDDLTLTEAARILDVHYMTAYRYVRTGLLPARQDEGQWIVARSDAEEMRSRRSRKGAKRAAKAKPRSQTAAERSVALAGRLVAGDEPGAWRIAEDALASGATTADLYRLTLIPALHLVGDRWAAGVVSVAEEHRATVTAMRIIGRLGATVGRRGRTRGSVVLAAAPGDRHSLPSAIVADLLRSRGFHVADLGADAPGEEIARAATGEDRLLAVGICVTNPLEPGGEEQLAEVVRTVADTTGAPVLVGGSALADIPDPLPGADHHSADLDDALDWFEQVADRQGSRGAHP